MIGISSIQRRRQDRLTATTVIEKTDRAAQPLPPGLSPADLQSFLGIDSSFMLSSESDLMEHFLRVSLDYCLKITGYEYLDDFDYTFRLDTDIDSMNFSTFLGGARWISLPRRDLNSVSEVRVNNNVIDAEDFSIDTKSNPARVMLNVLSFPTINEFNFIEIDAKCGPNGNIDSGFKMGVLMLAGYLFTNRTCSAGMDDALNKSGAKQFVNKVKVRVGGL